MKPLQDLTALILVENPIVALPHYLQFIIFHLRSLESLEGQPVTTQDRQEAFERFSLGKITLKKNLNLNEKGIYCQKLSRKNILYRKLNNAIKIFKEIDTINQLES